MLKSIENDLIEHSSHDVEWCGGQFFVDILDLILRDFTDIRNHIRYVSPTTSKP